MGFSGRKRKSTASDSTPSETESLTPFLWKGLAWGVFSASQIQQIAAACFQDFTSRQYEPPATRLQREFIYFFKTICVLYPWMLYFNLPTHLFNICSKKKMGKFSSFGIQWEIYQQSATIGIYLYIYTHCICICSSVSSQNNLCIVSIYVLQFAAHLLNIYSRRRCVSSAPWEAVGNISTISGGTCCYTWATRIFQDLYPLKPSSSMARNSRLALCLSCFLTKCLQRCIIITLVHGTNIFFLPWMQRKSFGRLRHEPHCSINVL